MSVTFTRITAYEPAYTVTFSGITVQPPPASVTFTGITVQPPPLSVTFSGIFTESIDPTVVQLSRKGASNLQMQRKGIGAVELHRVPDTPLPFGISGDWNLIWQDEFDAALNTSTWMTLRGLGAGYANPYNPSIEDGAFSSSYATVENSCLRLRWDPTPINVSGTIYPYTTGMAHTGKGFNFLYGYIEARIWVPNNNGIWPAFWMLPLPVDNHWPPEIDISEWLYNTSTNVIEPHFNVHWGTSPNNQQMGWKTYGTADAANHWHTYGLLWQPDKIQVIYDGIAGPTYTGVGVTTEAMYIILSAGIQKNVNPPAGNMLVDYVRVWQ